MVAGAATGGPAARPAGAQAPGPVAGWSTTEGTDGRVYIADEQGRALQFHGFNVKTGDPATDASDQLLADAAARGMDHMRLVVFWDHLEPAQGEFDEAYLDEIVAAMDRAERHGILVILDMHQDVFGEAFGSRGVPAWATRTDGLAYVPQDVWFLNYLQPAVQAAFEHLYEDPDLRQAQIDAWLHVVERVQDHPALFGYDLMNEPFGKIRPGEDLFTAAERVEREQLTAMFQRLTDAISAVDPDHWVFFEPPNLASLGIPTSLGEVRGPKVALYPHMYDPNIESATYTPGGVVEYDPAFFATWAEATVVYTEQHPIPLLVGEWGIAQPDRPGMDAFVRDSLATLEQVGSGWSVFNWCRGSGVLPARRLRRRPPGDRPDLPALRPGHRRRPHGLALGPDGADAAGHVHRQRGDRPDRDLRPRAVVPRRLGRRGRRCRPGRGRRRSTPPPASCRSPRPTRAGTHTICVRPEGSAAGCAGSPATAGRPDRARAHGRRPRAGGHARGPGPGRPDLHRLSAEAYRVSPAPTGRRVEEEVPLCPGPRGTGIALGAPSAEA